MELESLDSGIWLGGELEVATQPEFLVTGGKLILGCIQAMHPGMASTYRGRLAAH